LKPNLFSFLLENSTDENGADSVLKFSLWFIYFSLWFGITSIYFTPDHKLSAINWKLEYLFFFVRHLEETEEHLH